MNELYIKGKTGEILRRKATGPVKWQPVAVGIEASGGSDAFLFRKKGERMEGFITAKEMAVKWNLTERRVQKMCEDGLLPGVTKFGTIWAIPENVERPKDGRITTGQYRNWRKKKDS